MNSLREHRWPFFFFSSNVSQLYNRFDSLDIKATTTSTNLIFLPTASHLTVSTIMVLGHFLLSAFDLNFFQERVIYKCVIVIIMNLKTLTNSSLVWVWEFETLQK